MLRAFACIVAIVCELNITPMMYTIGKVNKSLLANPNSKF